MWVEPSGGGDVAHSRGSACGRIARGFHAWIYQIDNHSLSLGAPSEDSDVESGAILRQQDDDLFELPQFTSIRCRSRRPSPGVSGILSG